MITEHDSAVTRKEIRVGIIGANAKANWAKLSHVPAINGLPGLKLAAVATRNEESAREAAEAFGADRWFSDPFAMIRDDLIDVITISIKVPAHRELVLAAVDAGKAVYCEAPLGRSVAETEEMASAVGALYTAIGLQGRLNPAVRRAAQLLSSGKIGRPLNARIVSTTIGYGPELPSIMRPKMLLPLTSVPSTPRLSLWPWAAKPFQRTPSGSSLTARGHSSRSEFEKTEYQKFFAKKAPEFFGLAGEFCCHGLR